MAPLLTSPLAMVAATLNDKNAPTKLSAPDSRTAMRGGRAPVAIEVAMAFPVSWKPLVKSKAKATITTNAKVKSLFTRRTLSRPTPFGDRSTGRVLFLLTDSVHLTFTYVHLNIAPRELLLTSPPQAPRSVPSRCQGAEVLSEPVFAAEQNEQPDGQPDDEDGCGDQSGRLAEAGIGDVLAVPAGDGGRHGDDGRPAGHLLHDPLDQLSGLPAGIKEPILGLLNGLVVQLDSPKVPVDQIVRPSWPRRILSSSDRYRKCMSKARRPDTVTATAGRPLADRCSATIPAQLRTAPPEAHRGRSGRAGRLQSSGRLALGRESSVGASRGVKAAVAGDEVPGGRRLSVGGAHRAEPGTFIQQGPGA